MHLDKAKIEEGEQNMRLCHKLLECTTYWWDIEIVERCKCRLNIEASYQRQNKTLKLPVTIIDVEK